MIIQIMHPFYVFASLVTKDKTLFWFVYFGTQILLASSVSYLIPYFVRKEKFWFWALAFLWMPILCSLLFYVAIGPSATDDIIMWLSLFIAIPIVCGVAAAKVARFDFPSKKVWRNLNILAAIVSIIGGIVLLRFAAAWAKGFGQL